MKNFYSKLLEFGKSFLWFLGAAILTVQTYRIVAYYIFDVPFEVNATRDGSFAVLGFAMMFIQNALKTAVVTLIKKFTNKSGNNA